MAWEALKPSPSLANSSAPPAVSAAGHHRSDFGMDMGYNMIHGSDAPETAEFELGLWFPEA